MKNNEAFRSREEALSAALAVMVLLIFPLYGATAMLAAAAIGLLTWVFIFRERLRDHPAPLILAISLASAGLIAAAIVFALSFFHGH